MAKIESYPQADAPLSGSDMLIGTDVVNDNETKNFTLNDLAAFINGSIGGQFVPYTGATGSVNLGSNSLTALNVSITGALAANNGFGSSNQVLISTGGGVVWGNFSVPTLQQVLTSGRDLTNDRNFQGQGSGTSNTGISVIGFGINSALLNTGDYVIGLGVSSVGGNTGTYVIGIGVGASAQQTGNDVIGIGRQASQGNIGGHVISIGNASASSNSGNHVNAIGQAAGANNTHNYINLFGISAVATASNQTVLAGEEYQARLDYNGLTIDRQYDMPDADGTLVLSVNGTAPDAQGDVTVAVSAPYLVYTGVITGTSPVTVNVLQNTLGVALNWSNPSNGLIKGTLASGNFADLDKIWITSGCYRQSPSFTYFVSSRISGFNSVDLDFVLHDGTQTGTPNVNYYAFEIRVYP